MMTDRSSKDSPATVEVRRGTAPATPHAQAAKVLTTGLSVSMVLGIVAYLANSAAAEEQAKAEADLLAQIAALQQTTTTSLLLDTTATFVVGDTTSVPPLETLVPGQTPVTAQPVGGSTAGGASGSTGSGSGGSTGGTTPVTAAPPTATTVVANPPVTTTPPPPPPPPPPTTSTTTAVSG
jgi:hypothetical protein